MAVLIESSVFITAERRGLVVSDLLNVLPNEPSALSAIVASELLFGVHRADSPARRARREAFVETILAAFTVLTFDLPIARLHALLGSDLLSAGRPIGDHDRIIAATALAHGYDVLTDNPSDFVGVPGLGVRRPNW
jgi:predicted nucleic acid-binding protein